MRVDTLVPLQHFAEYWDYTTTQIPDSNETINEYFKSADIRVMMTENNGVPLAFCRELLRFNGQLRNVTDPNGVEILDPNRGGYYFIGTAVAQFDVFGNIMGYKYTITPQFNPDVV